MFETLFTFLDEMVVDNISSMVGVFTDVITPLIGACVGIYIVYVAYELIINSQKVVYQEVIKTIGSLSITTFVALNTSWYMSHIVPTVLYAGDDIANALIGGKGGASSLQAIFDQITMTFEVLVGMMDLDFLSSDSWKNTTIIVLEIIFVLFGGGAFLLIATGYLLVAKITVSFLLILGPLFIMFAFFPSCRSFFQAWTGQCFNYTLLSITYPLAFGLFTSILSNTVFNGTLNFATCMMTFVIFGALILLSVQIPTFCSALSGGVGINGLVGGTLNGVSGIASLGKGIASGASGAYKTGQVVKSAAKEIGRGNISPG